MAGPLAGIRVLDLSRFYAGAYCTLLLADLGADVVKVEPPGGGDPLRAMGDVHVALNRGKRSVTLDTRRPEGVEVLRRLIAGADVVVENGKPGSMEAMGLGYDQAAAVNPGVVYCSITGYGQDSPYADRPGHDVTYVAQGGLLAALESSLPWNPQAMVAVPTGSTMACLGVLAALTGRAATGRGAYVDASLADAATWLLAGDPNRFSGGGLKIGLPASRRLYACADGRYVSVAAMEPRTWKALVEGLGLPELATQLGGADQEEQAAKIAAAFATRPAAEWVDVLGPAGAAVGPVHEGPDMVDDPHAKARGVFTDVGGTQVVTSPLRLRNATGPVPGAATSPPSALGADTDTVLADAGFTTDEIAALRTAGAV